jgi:hypothetical protein
MSENTNKGTSLTGVLLIVFIVLKLTNNIDWSWWWVLSPLWIPILLVISIMLIGAILVGIIELFNKW